MEIVGNCPGCGNGYRFPESAQGKVARCNSCQERFRVPSRFTLEDSPRRNRRSSFLLGSVLILSAIIASLVIVPRFFPRQESPAKLGEVARAIGAAAAEKSTQQPQQDEPARLPAQAPKPRKKAAAALQAKRKKMIDELIEQKVFFAFGRNKRTGQDNVLLVPDSFKFSDLETRVNLVGLVYLYQFEGPDAKDPDQAEWIRTEPGSHAIYVQELSGKIIADMIGGQYVDRD